MDLGAFVQENRRWLLGCLGGCVVYLIASIVLRSVFGGFDETAVLALVRSARNAELYNQAALDAATEEATALQQERQRLAAEISFRPTARYQLAGKGAPDEYLFQVGRKLKQSILVQANERDVMVQDKDISYPAATGIEEIRATLFGLELLDEATQRLFAAHDAVRKRQPDARGLRAIQAFRVEERKGPRPMQRSQRPGEVDLRDLVVQERVVFQFEADTATTMEFLEACRQAERTLTIEGLQIQGPQRLGDPVTVKGSLQGIAWKEQ